MSEPGKIPVVDVATYTRWGKRIFIGVLVVLSPFIIGLFVSFIYSLRRVKNVDSALGDMIGSLVFLIIFCLIPFGVYQGMMKFWPFIKARQQHPNQPWLWKADWVDGKIPFSRLHNVIGYWIGWTLVTSVGFGLIRWFSEEIPQLGVPILWAYGGAAVLSVWVGVGALVESRRYQKFGTTYCHLVGPTGVFGGWLRTRVELPLALIQGESVQAILRLMIKVKGSDGDSSSWRTIWRIDRTVAFDEMEIVSNRDTFIPVDLYIPQDIGVNTDAGSFGGHQWRLDVNAKLAGLDYDAEFEVPVFTTSDSSAVAPTEAVEQFGASVDSANSFMPPDDIKVTPFDGGIELRRVKVVNMKKYVVGFSVMGVALIAASIFGEGDMFAFVRMICTPVAAVLLLIGADEKYSYNIIRLMPAGAIRKARFIFYSRDRTIPIENIREVWIEGSHGSSTSSYRVDIKSYDSPPTVDFDGPPPEKLQMHWNINIKGITVAYGIGKTAQAEWLKELVEGYYRKQGWVPGEDAGDPPKV